MLKLVDTFSNMYECGELGFERKAGRANAMSEQEA
jgi:hypothetical protein